MRIQSSTVAMASSHALRIEHYQTERLEAWVDPPAASAPPAKPAAPAVSPPAEVPPAEAAEDRPFFEPSPIDKLKLAIIERLLESLMGKPVKIDVPEDLQDPKEINELRKKLEALVSNARELRPAREGRPAAEAPQRQGWGLRYDYYERYHEQEKSSFSAAGVIKTQDGKEIAFSVDLHMQREFLREESIQIRAGDAPLKDPLVINFDGTAAELTQTKFQFDLDADGEEDQISFLKPGSGFLVQDADEDGRIADGREVFGALSGDAYADLAQHDEDGNGWLDEGDAIFSKLRIWTKNEQGEDQLFALGEKGIGALFLGAIASPYSLSNTNNELQGMVRRTGVFLREDGSAGTMQQIDLAV
jgi:hypothetical protein